MTTATRTYASSGTQATDADFQRLIREYTELLAAAGLIQTSDTGQVNPDTAVRPGASATTMYQVWRFNDSLQVLSPVFLKVFYSTGNGSVNNAKIYVSVGQGSDGSGNLTGIVSSLITNDGNDTGSSGTNVNSFACHTEGFFGVINRQNGAPSISGVGAGCFFVCRSCDANGYPTGDGLYVFFGGQYGNAMAVSFTPGVGQLNTPNTKIFQLPLGVGSNVNGEIPFFPIWMPLPHLVPVFGTLVFPAPLIISNDIIDIAIVGSRVRRYLVARKAFVGITSSNELGFGMLWE